MKTRLALFDLDGTLYDTRRVNFLSYQKALEQFGYTMDYEYFANQCNGRHYKTFLPEIMQSETHMEEVHELKKKYYGDFLSETVENTYLRLSMQSVTSIILFWLRLLREKTVRIY